MPLNPTNQPNQIELFNHLVTITKCSLGRVFANDPGPGFNPRSRHIKDFKKVLDTS